MFGNQIHLARQDRPIGERQNDALDRGPFVDNLVRSLIEDKLSGDGKLIARTATGTVIGLTGEWGLGKSSVLNLLHEKLSSMDLVTVATFNPWLFRGRDELLRAFFTELRAAMGRSGREQFHAARESLDRYWAAIDLAAHGGAAVAEAHGFVGAVKTWRSLGDKAKKIVAPGELSPQQERQSLESKLKQTNCAIVVLIDELDRVDDDDVHAVAQLVKAVGDIRGISYLVAYDHDRVADALGRGDTNRRSYGERYLEKIVAHTIPLRPLFDGDVRTLIAAAVSNFETPLLAPSTAREEKIEKWLVANIRTPREVKRLIGSFSTLERVVRGEIAPYDILAYAWILTKSTGLRDKIAKCFDRLVEDPSEDEVVLRVTERMGEGKNRKISPSEILGDAAVPFEGLLALLFPRFGEDKRADIGQDGMQISRRQNLVRLLYLGDPPGLISVARTKEIWAISDVHESESTLRSLMDEGLLEQVLDRMDDVSGELPLTADRIFWPALSRVAQRAEPWAKSPSAERAAADAGATLLMRLALRDKTQVARVKQIIQDLIAQGDLLLVPYILRKHLFAHGLTRFKNGRSSEFVLNKLETEELLDTEHHRYKSAVLDGTALKFLPQLEAMYVLSNTERWDEELKASLTRQLSDPQALATYATLLVPPGYSVDRSHLEEMFDIEAVRVVAAGIEVARLDPWVGSSVTRLRQAMDGRDPLFLEED